MQAPYRYIDIHTHRDMPSPGVLSLNNRYDRFAETAAGAYYSMGLHPWYLSDVPRQLRELEEQAGSPAVLAIGECGLDALCATDRKTQEEAFAAQIELANALRKPLVIHCVRAFPETLRLLQRASVPAVFHGFNRHTGLALQILSQGHYLSFGAALLQRPGIMKDILNTVPPGRFFLETDDAGTDIAEIYKAAAAIRKTGEDVIILQLKQNFKEVFGL